MINAIKKINKLKTKYEDDLRKAESAVAEVETLLANAIEEKEKAADNADAFCEKASRCRTLEELVSIRKEWLKKVKTQPVISADEEREIRAEIFSALDEKNKEAASKLVRMVSEMLPIKEALSKEINEANEALGYLSVYLSKTTPESSSYFAPRYNDFSVTGFIDRLETSPFYKKYKV